MKMYPATFVEWLLNHAEIDIEDDEFKWVVGVETHVIEYMTTEQAYKFWKTTNKN